MIKLHRFGISGHCHRVELFLSLLGLPFEMVEVDLASGAHKRPDFLAGGKPTLADIANYSCTAHAPEGGVSLQPYPNVRAWLARIEALPGFVPMVKSPLPQAA